MPEITVMCAVYNGSNFVAPCIESILEQSFTDIEIIFINDCSTDNTAEIIRSFDDKRIHLYDNAVNLGQSKTLNRGLELSNGKYIARIDHDDIMLPHRLEAQYREMEDNPELGMCGSSFYVIDGQNNRTGPFLRPRTDTVLRWRCLFNNPFQHPAVMMRKELGLPYFCDEGHCTKYTEKSLTDELNQAGLRITYNACRCGEIWVEGVDNA